MPSVLTRPSPPDDEMAPDYAHLNLTCRNHLFAEIVLVFANTAVPPPHRLVLTDHDVLGDLVEQSVGTRVSSKTLSVEEVPFWGVILAYLKS